MNKTDKYYLKAYHIGYEVPIYDLEDTEGQDDLARGICSKYLDWFDVIEVEIKIHQLQNTNYLLLFNLVTKVDMNSVDIDTMNEDWKKMQTDISAEIEKYLESKNLIFKPIYDIDL